MKRFKMTSLPLLCAAVAPLCADSGMMRSGSSNSSHSDQQKQQKYMQEMNKITPSAEPSVTRCADPFMTADFILWKVQEDGLNYAYDGVGGTGVATLAQGKMRHPRFKWEPGFKVGAGLKFRHDGWDVYAQYTYLRLHSHNSVGPTGIAGTLNSNIFTPGSATGTVTGTLNTFAVADASSSWRQNLNALDVELARNFWISKWLTLRPFTGLKFAWNPQKFSNVYHGIGGTGTELDIKMRIHHFGVGIRSGLNMAFYFARKFALVGDLAISGLWNNFRSVREDTRLATGAVTPDIFLKVKKSNPRLTTVFEWDLGLRFESAFHNDDYMFQADLVWEEQVWSGQNQFVSLPNSVEANDLTYHGLTFKVGFWF